MDFDCTCPYTCSKLKIVTAQCWQITFRRHILHLCLKTKKVELLVIIKWRLHEGKCNAEEERQSFERNDVVVWPWPATKDHAVALLLLPLQG